MTNLILEGKRARYIITKDLGEGYFAKVFLVSVEAQTGTRLPSSAVIKVAWNGSRTSLIEGIESGSYDFSAAYPPGISDAERQDFDRRFEVERVVLDGLRKAPSPINTSVPEVYEFSNVAGKPKFYAMEFIDSEQFRPLVDMLESDSIEEPRALQIMRDYLKVMVYLHEEMHRYNEDIQFKNLFWSPHDGLKVIDWNGVSWLDQEPDKQREQLVRSITMLSRILFQMLTNAAIFTEVTAPSMLAEIGAGKWGEVSPGTQDLLMRWTMFLPPSDKPTSELLREVEERLSLWSLTDQALVEQIRLSQELLAKEIDAVSRVEDATALDKLALQLRDLIHVSDRRTRLSFEVQSSINETRKNLKERLETSYRYELGIRDLRDNRLDTAVRSFEAVRYLGLPVERALLMVDYARAPESRSEYLRIRTDYRELFNQLLASYRQRDSEIDWEKVATSFAALREQAHDGIDLVGGMEFLEAEANFLLHERETQRIQAEMNDPEQLQSSLERVTQIGARLLVIGVSLSVAPFLRLYEPRINTLRTTLDQINTRSQEREKLQRDRLALQNAFTQSIDSGLRLLDARASLYKRIPFTLVLETTEALRSELIAASDWEGASRLLHGVVSFLGTSKQALSVTRTITYFEENQERIDQVPVIFILRAQAECARLFLAFRNHLKDGQHSQAANIASHLLDINAHSLPEVVPALASELKTYFDSAVNLSLNEFDDSLEHLGKITVRVDNALIPAYAAFQARIEAVRTAFSTANRLVSEKRTLMLESEGRSQLDIFADTLETAHAANNLSDLRAVLTELLNQSPRYSEIEHLRRSFDELIKRGKTYTKRLHERIGYEEIVQQIPRAEGEATLQAHINALRTLSESIPEAALLAARLETLVTYLPSISKAKQFIDRTMRRDSSGALIGLREELPEDAAELQNLRAVIAQVSRLNGEIGVVWDPPIMQSIRAGEQVISQPQGRRLRERYLDQLVSEFQRNPALLPRIADSLEALALESGISPDVWQRVSAHLDAPLRQLARSIVVDSVSTGANKLQHLVLAERIRWLGRGNPLEPITGVLEIPEDLDVRTDDTAEQYARSLGRLNLPFVTVRTALHRVRSKQLAAKNISLRNELQVQANSHAEELEARDEQRQAEVDAANAAEAELKARVGRRNRWLQLELALILILLLIVGIFWTQLNTDGGIITGSSESITATALSTDALLDALITGEAADESSKNTEATQSATGNPPTDSLATNTPPY